MISIYQYTSLKNAWEAVYLHTQPNFLLKTISNSCPKIIYTCHGDLGTQGEHNLGQSGMCSKSIEGNAFQVTSYGSRSKYMLLCHSNQAEWTFTIWFALELQILLSARLHVHVLVYQPFIILYQGSVYISQTFLVYISVFKLWEAILNISDGQFPWQYDLCFLPPSESWAGNASHHELC